MSEQRAPVAPSDLVARGRGRRFWGAVLADYELDATELEQLSEICRQLDTLDGLRQLVADEGLLMHGPSGPRTHPALVEARQIRIEVRRALGQLALPSLDDCGRDAELPPAVTSFRSNRARRAARARWGHGGV